MQLIKKIWHDPVWSKVISGILLFVLGALFSLIKGWVSNTETIPEAFISVFTYEINIWFAVAITLIIMILSGVAKRIHNNRERIPQPPFVNDFTRWRYQNQIWTWRWKWSPTYKFYYITDLNIECPNCHEGLLTLEYNVYRCAKCNAEIPYVLLNTTNETVAKQILEDARKKYDYCAEYIGKLPVGALVG